jgi:hypothetical protein
MGTVVARVSYGVAVLVVLIRVSGRRTVVQRIHDPVRIGVGSRGCVDAPIRRAPDGVEAAANPDERGSAETSE